MPSYTFTNTATNEEETHFLKMSELDEFKKNNEHLKQKLTTGNVIGGLSTSSGSLPEGLRDTFREMKKKHPRSTGVDNFI